MPVAARRARWPNGRLTAAILRVLRGADGPLSVHEIGARMRAEETGFVHLSGLFRLVNKMLDDHAVRKVELLPAYRIDDVDDPVDVVCLDCRRAVRIGDAGNTARLAAMAAARGFRPSRYIVKVSARCAECQARSD